MVEQLLKAPNQRGDGISTVRRLAGDAWPEIGGNEVISKFQRGYFCRPLWNLCRRTPMVEREARALIGTRKAGVHVPLVLEYRHTDSGSELITTFIPDALHLDAALAHYPGARAQILHNTGREIGKLHRARWTHGALYADHILVCAAQDFRVYLVDLEKGRRSLRAGRDLARFFRHNSYLSAADIAEFQRAYRSARQHDPHVQV